MAQGLAGWGGIGNTLPLGTYLFIILKNIYRVKPPSCIYIFFMIFLGWTFCDWLIANGNNRNIIKEWLDSLPVEAKVAINIRLNTMRGLQKWPEGWASSYQGYSGIIELRIPWNRVQYRPLGCYGPKRWQFTLLSGAIEKGGKIRRPILEAAASRKNNLNQGCVCEHQYD